MTYSRAAWFEPLTGDVRVHGAPCIHLRHVVQQDNPHACCRSVDLHHVLAPDVALAGVLRQLVLLQVCPLVHHAKLPAVQTGLVAGIVDLSCQRRQHDFPLRLSILYQDFRAKRCHTIAAESLSSLPECLRRLTLDLCSGVPACALGHMGRLSALEHLALIGLPNATSDADMQQLAPQLHVRLSGLYFCGFTDTEVCTVCAIVWTHILTLILSRMFAAEN